VKRLALLLAGMALVAGCSAPSAPAPAVEPVPAAPTSEAPVEVPVRVDIPALHVTDDLVPVGMNALENGELLPVDSVGWYELSPRPGEPGRAVLAGHINWRERPGAPLIPGAFAHLPQVKVGDLVTTAAADGTTTTFRVYLTKQVKKASYTDVTVPMVFGPSTGAELALVTCSGAVIGHSYDSNTVVLARAI
jgi:sortase (surface protein transpeptidase)